MGHPGQPLSAAYNNEIYSVVTNFLLWKDAEKCASISLFWNCPKTTIACRMKCT